MRKVGFFAVTTQVFAEKGRAMAVLLHADKSTQLILAIVPSKVNTRGGISAVIERLRLKFVAEAAQKILD